MIFQAVMSGIGAIGGIVTGIQGRRQAKRREAKAKKREKKARKEMNRLKNIYGALDTSNPYMNMENKLEDLTINQKQAQFESQQFQQSQANILDSLKGAAGGGGVAALAQQLAQQGQLAAQKSAASIGQQEATNQRLAAQESARLDTLERKGVSLQQQAEREKYGTLLGMAQQETAAYGAERRQAQQDKLQSTQSMFEGFGSAASSMSGMIPTGKNNKI